MEITTERNRVVRATTESHNCVNPVRSCEEKYFKDAMEMRNKSKSLLKLSIGDPSVFGNLPPPKEAIEGVQEAIISEKYNGYAHSSGLPEVRKALAEQYSTDKDQLTPDDVVLTNACSGALQMAIEVLCEPGSSVLIPSPGFGVYKCLTDAGGIKTKFYQLLPDKGWEIDLADLEGQLDDTVSAIIVNTPSNPCGCVYSKKHLLEILEIAQRHKCPIISDDVYQNMVFSGVEYTSLASLSSHVPILSCGGISKRFMVPGWRLGWILIHDRNGAFEKEVRPGLSRLAMKLLGPCTLVQGALPRMLQHTPSSYHDNNMSILQRNAELVHEGLSRVAGLSPVMPAGAMYMMVVIDLDCFPDLDDDVAFTKRLLIEESVFCLPGNAFYASGCFRVVLIMPDKEIEEALQRIQLFCSRYHVKVA